MRLLCAVASLVRWQDYGTMAAQRRPALETFTILTTDPNEVTEPFHNRMPVILEPRTISDGWSLAIRRGRPSI